GSQGGISARAATGPSNSKVQAKQKVRADNRVGTVAGPSRQNRRDSDSAEGGPCENSWRALTLSQPLCIILPRSTLTRPRPCPPPNRYPLTHSQCGREGTEVSSQGLHRSLTIRTHL